MLFVPGHISRMIEKAAGAGADCVVLDLEDAVPPASKNEARKIIRLVLQDGRFDRQAVMVRVNSFDTGRTAEDVASVACAELDGFVYAMSRNRGEIHAMSRLLSEQEKALGRVVVRATFKVSRIGTVAGCYVSSGLAVKNAKVRLIRDNVVIRDNISLDSLKHFKDDVREVKAGFECGIKLAGFDDIKIDDVLEFYEIIKVARTLDS